MSLGWTVTASGTQTAVVGTEQTLNTSSTAATYQLNVDTVNMVLGDTLELRIYKQIDGTNYRQVWKGTWSQPQINIGKISPPIETAGNLLKFTLKQTAGTARTFPWSLEQI